MNKETTETKDALLKKLKALAKEYEDKLAELDKNQEKLANEKPSKAPVIRDVSRENGEEYVEIKLFRDGDKYKDDVLVGINGYMCRVKRGVPVRIKRKFADIITMAEDNTAKVNADFLSKDGKMERYC